MNHLFYASHISPIFTAYVPATDRRGARIKVTWGNEKRFISYPYEQREGLNAHTFAVKEFLKGREIGGDISFTVAPMEKGYVFSGFESSTGYMRSEINV